jgi:hypothetical protein
MATGDTAVILNNKQSLGLVELKDLFFSLLDAWTGDVTDAMWGEDGWFGSDAPTLSSGAEGEFTIEAGKYGTDGVGNLLKSGETKSYDADVKFPNVAATDYMVGLMEATVPTQVKSSKHSGTPQYTAEEYICGYKLDADGVLVVGSDLKVVVTSLFEPGIQHVGRQVYVWLKTPVSADPAEAFFTGTVAWDGASNYVLVTGYLGQTSPSTTASDYYVCLLGPRVQIANLDATAGVLYCGTVEGTGGGGGAATVFDYTGVTEFFDWPDLQNVIEIGPNGDLKIRVKSHASDSNTRQISAWNSVAGEFTFRVNEDGVAEFLKNNSVVFKIDPTSLFAGQLHYNNGNKGWAFEQGGGDELYLKGRDKDENLTVEWDANAQQLTLYRSTGTIAATWQHGSTTALQLYDTASLRLSFTDTYIKGWTAGSVLDFHVDLATGHIEEFGGKIKSTLSEIYFSDANTTADVKLTEDSGVYTQLPATGPQDDSIVAILNGAVTEDLLSSVLVDGGVISDAGGLYVAMSDARGLYKGMKHFYSAETLELTPSSTVYVALDFSFQALVETTAANFKDDGDGHVFLAKVVTGATTITSITDVRRPLAIRMDRVAGYELFVGQPGSSSAWVDKISMFDTIGDAFDFINIWTSDPTERERWQWTIRVIGTTAENAPLTVPVDGIRIVSEPFSGTGGCPLIQWNQASYLFDFYGKSHLHFEGLTAEHTGSRTTGSYPAVCMFGDSYVPGVDFERIDIKIKGCSLDSGDAFFFFNEQTHSVLKDIVIEDCFGSDLGSGGVIMRGLKGAAAWDDQSENIHIRRNRFYTLASATGTTNDKIGVAVSVDQASVEANTLIGFDDHGIRVMGSSFGVQVRKNNIRENTQVPGVGIQVDSGATAAVDNNYVGATGTYGISIQGQYSTAKENSIVGGVVGVYVSAGDVVVEKNGIWFVSSYGIRVWSTSASYCRIVRNTIESPGDHAIYVGSGTTGPSHVLAEKNTIKGGDTYGIYVDDGASYACVIGNTIDDTDRSAIYVADSDYVRVCDNDIVDACTDDNANDAGVQWAGTSAHGRTERNTITLATGLSNVDQAIYYDAGDVHFCKNNDCPNGKIEQVGPTGPDDFIIGENMTWDDIVVNGDDVVLIGNLTYGNNISLANGAHHAVVGNHTMGGNIALQNAATQYAEVVGNHLRVGGAVTGVHANDDAAHNMP